MCRAGVPHNYRVIKPAVKRVALELGSYLQIDPTVQSAGPAYINQIKILVCSEFEANANRPDLYTKGVMLAEHGVHVNFDDKHVTCSEVWKLDCIQSILKIPGVEISKADLCMYGMTTRSERGEMALAMKPTTFMGNCPRIM